MLLWLCSGFFGPSRRVGCLPAAVAFFLFFVFVLFLFCFGCLRGAWWFLFLLVVAFSLAFPCFASGLLVLPLCGAALTFFAAAKKDKQRKRLKPLILKWVPQLGGGSGASGIRVLAHSA
ncbi:hypothetical protein [Paraburkholderia fungorum]|uniref:hypothetical protein n=1 Tax=Paraburkholderia fungorum TaxID=134537 RepID=UPI0011C46687|nr:hypothetical protein [Paraburkholderia fungorum]